MVLLLSIVFSVVICLAVLAVLMWVRTPLYRVSTEQVIRVLELMLLGQATENDWRIFLGYPIRQEPFLDDIRHQCQLLDEEHFIGDSHTQGFLLDKAGRLRVAELLEEVRRYQRQNRG